MSDGRRRVLTSRLLHSCQLADEESKSGNESQDKQLMCRTTSRTDELHNNGIARLRDLFQTASRDVDVGVKADESYFKMINDISVMT